MILKKKEKAMPAKFIRREKKKDAGIPKYLAGRGERKGLRSRGKKIKEGQVL